MRILFFLMIFLSSSVHAKEIVLLADEWCPFNCDPNSKEPGYAIEVVSEILSKKGYTVKYEVASWARSKNLVRRGKAHGIVAAYKADAPDFIYPKKSLLKVEDRFFVNSESNIFLVKETDIYNQRYQLGMIKGYGYSDKFDEFVIKKPSNVTAVHGNLPIRSLIKMLNAKRIDVALEEVNVWNYNVIKMGLDPKKFEHRGTFSFNEIYIAFSPAKRYSTKLAEILDDGLKELEKNGRLRELRKKYHIELVK